MPNEDPQAGRAVTVGLMADPGLPEDVSEAIARQLCRDLSDHVDADVRWAVDTCRSTLPLTADGRIPLREHAGALKTSRRWDYVVHLTDLPRSLGPGSVLCEIDAAESSALICLPALGAWALRSRVRRLLPAVVRQLHEKAVTPGAAPGLDRYAGVGRPVLQRGPEGVSYLTLPGAANRVRLLAGMVRSNRPGRLLRALSNCMAAAIATGAFAVFYAAMWPMAEALSPARLTLISVASVTMLSAWLIIHNDLWTRLDGADVRQVLLDNAATIVTVELSVAMMYLVVYAALLCGAVAVIVIGYLQKQLGHPADLLDYARLSWLAASLGTVAGALGSNVDNDEAIHEAAYSRREHQRRQLGRNTGT